MIYFLIRPPEIAAVETDAGAARLERAGYERVPAWRFVYWWSIRDAHAYARLRGEGRRQDLGERVVGGALAGRWKVYKG